MRGKLVIIPNRYGKDPLRAIKIINNARSYNEEKEKWEINKFKVELENKIHSQYKEHPKYIDVTDWDVSKVTNMDSMFVDYKHLEEIKGLNTWDVSNVENMQDMFYGCNNLKVLDLSNWDTGKVTNMSGMFDECRKLEEIKGIENWNTSNLEEIWGMFDMCDNLKGLDLTKWDLSNIKDGTPEQILEEIQELTRQ